MSSARLTPAQLLALYLIALVVRVVGIHWGAPYGDEHIWNSARALGGQLVFEDHFYPPLIHYLNAVGFALMYGVGRLIGVWHGTDELRAQYFADPTPFYLMGRLVTALISAALAPLGALIARRLAVAPLGSLLVGLGMALLPVNVLWAHVMKPMVGMTTGVVLTVWAVLAFLDRPSSRWRAAGVGAAAAFAVAFKHSAVFIVLPLLVSLPIVLVVAQRRPVKDAVVASLIAIAGGAVTWVPLSIGIVLDFANFMEFQRIQYYMSSREFGLAELFGATGPVLFGLHSGATPVLFLVFFLLPFLQRDLRLLILWAITLGSTLWIASITGARVFSGLYLPFSVLIALLSLVGLARAQQAGPPRGRLLAAIALGLGLLGCAFGTARVAQQAIAQPIQDRIRPIIEAEAVPQTTRILSHQSNSCGVPVAQAAKRAERARDVRLAAKYGVDAPPQEKERAEALDDPNAYFVHEFPYVLHGLEPYKDDEIEVTTFSGIPLQPEEWHLKHWTDQGFELFVVFEGRLLFDDPIMSPLLRELREQAEVVAHLPNERELFFELPVTIFRAKKTN